MGSGCRPPVRAAGIRGSYVAGLCCTVVHHNTHLAMSLKTGELPGRAAILRGGWGFSSPG
jgi:hypothetical protein